MAIRRYKKISELDALESASLSTYVAGVDNGETVKITLDILASGVRDTINTVDNIRLTNLENYTASFTAVVDLSGLNSFTASQLGINTAFTNGINSRLTTSSFNEYTASVSTAGLVDRLNSLEAGTSSYETTGRGIISSSAQLPSGLISGSEQVLGGSGVYSSSAQIDGFETTGRGILSGSISYTSLTDIPEGIVSGSDQLTSSLNELYVISGSITQTTWDNIANKPNDIISSSAQITTYGFVSGSYETTGRNILSGSILDLLPNGTISSSAQISTFGFISESVDISGLNSFTQSTEQRIGSLEAATSSYLTSLNGAISSSEQILGGTGILSGSVSYTDLTNIPNDIISSSAQITTYGFVSGSYETTGRGILSGSVSYTDLTNIPNGIISSSAQLENATITNLTITNLTTINETASIIYSSGSNQLGDQLTDTQILSGSVQIVGGLTINGVQVSTQSFVDLSSLNTFTSSANTSITNLNNATSSYELKGSGIVSSSTQITSFGFVSGSYETTGRGIISSSADLVTTSSFNTYTASISTASLVTSIDNLNTFTASQSTASLVNRLNTIESVSGSWITESETGSFLTSLNGAISGSSQLTASYDTRYELQGREIISSSNQIAGLGYATTSSLNTFTQSYYTDSSSLDSRLDVLEAYSASQQVPTSSFSFRTSQTDVYVKNSSGAQIDKGKVVRIVGAVGDNPLIVTASFLTEGQSANTLGITTENIANDSFGWVITEGVLLGVNTTGMNAGQLLFLGENGSFTTAFPVAPNHGVRLGEVLREQQNAGSIYVRIDNGSELGEAHDVVDSSTNSSYGDLLIKSGSVWINSKTLNSDYTVSGSLFISGTTEFGGDLVPKTAQGATLGTSERPFSDIFVSSGSIHIASDVSGSPDTQLSNVSGNILISAGGIQLLGTGSFNALTGSFSYLSGSVFYTDLNSTLNQFSSSVDSRLDNQEAFSSSLSVIANSSTKILNRASYAGGSSWQGTYTGNGGRVLVQATLTGYVSSVALYEAYLKRNGVTVDTTKLFFNATSQHTTFPTLYYVGENETGSNTYSVVVGAGVNLDSGDHASIVVTETYNFLNQGLISGSAQIAALGYVTSSAAATIPEGTISSSAQITSFGFVSGSYETTGRNIISSSTQISELGYVTSGGNVTFNSVTANQYIVSSSVYYVTQSYSSGSTIFGNTTDDTHQFTGSVLISGSLTANLTNGYMWAGNSLNKSYEIPTSSLLSTASFNSFTSSQFNTLSSSVATVQTNLNSLTASLGVTSTPFNYVGVVNPSNYVLVSYPTASYNGGSMDIIVSRASDSTAVSNFCLIASYGGTGTIASKGSQNSGAGAPNPSFDTVLSGGNMNIRISVAAGTYNIKGVARLF